MSLILRRVTKTLSIVKWLCFHVMSSHVMARPCFYLFVLFCFAFCFCFVFSECQFTLTDDSGTFQTPGFPDKYPNNIECIWNIQVKPGRFVLLSFDLFELESYKGKCIDLVEVKDGSRSTDQLLGGYLIETVA